MIREKIIENIVKGRSVLDIGSAADGGDKILWNLIRKSSAEVTGIDVLPCEDPDVVHGDMESYDFEGCFDVIVMGDVIEHVNNPGLLLANIRKHLKKNGQLIVTTPNAKWWTVAYRPHPEHVVWHDKYTLTKLLQRFGFSVEQFVFYPGNNIKEFWLFRFLHAHRAMLVVCH